MILDQRFKALKHFVVKDESKFPVREICIRNGKAYVTNGHYMVIIPLSDQTDEDFPLVDGAGGPVPRDAEVLIDPETLFKALDSAPKNSTIPILSSVLVTQTEKNILVSATDNEKSVTLTAPRSEKKYPDASQIKSTGPPDVEFSVDARYLAMIVKLIPKQRDGTVRIQLWTNETKGLKCGGDAEYTTTKAINVVVPDAVNGNTEMIIMPRRD